MTRKETLVSLISLNPYLSHLIEETLQGFLHSFLLRRRRLLSNEDDDENPFLDDDTGEQKSRKGIEVEN